ncbi:uncharacterized protein LOC135334177 isoform X4 [Halichondria panicea]|uniref:uncharacterized protein LOC135334177 isoform X4 n=1 Tax=Halichondria panicea TaxID=6063 RepID=UPI00312BAD3C
MGIGVELWRALVGLFNGGRGGRSRKASLAHQKLQCDVTMVLRTQCCTTSHRDKFMVESVLNNTSNRAPPSNCREDVVPEKGSVTNRSRNHSSSIRLGLTLMLILVFVSLLLLLAGDVELNPGPGLDTVLTISDILEVYEKVRSASPDWFNLGLALKLSYTDLTNFRDTYRGDNDVCLRETLARRLQSGGPLTWEGICTALKHPTVKRNYVAVEIEKHFKSRERKEVERTQGTKESTSSLTVCKKSISPSREELEADSMKMEIQFSALVSDLLKSLQIRRISKGSVVASLAGFNTLKKVFGRRNQCVFRAQRGKLDKCSTITDVWKIIADYFSFFNYEIVDQITNSLGTDEDKENMKLYKTCFIEYARRRLVKEEISSDSREDTVTMIVKLDSSYDNCELSRLKLFEWNLSSILNLNDVVLKLGKIDDGCIELTFLLPSFITSDIFPLSTDQERALQSQGVLQLHCGDVHYPAEQPVLEAKVQTKGRVYYPRDLHKAARAGDLSALQDAIMRGEDVNSVDEDGCTPLIAAAVGGHADSVKELLSSGAVVDLADKGGCTPLMWAAMFGHTDCIRELLSSGAVVDLANKDGQTPLYWAARGGHTDCVIQLLSSGAVVDLANKNGSTPLMMAARGGHTGCVRQLLSSGAVVDLADEDGWTALMVAKESESSNPSVIKLLEEATESHDHDTVREEVPSKLGPSAKRVTLQELVEQYNLTDEQLNSEIEVPDTPELALCFDDVELYSTAMGLAIAEQADVNQSRGTQAAMMKCLQIWKQHNPSQATYRALLDIALRLGKGDTAHQICQQLTQLNIQNRTYLKKLDELMADTSGTIELHYLKTHFIGPSGLGKTTTRQRLVGSITNLSLLPEDQRKRCSTLLAECEQVLAFVDKSGTKLEFKASSSLEEETQFIFSYLMSCEPIEDSTVSNTSTPKEQPKKETTHQKIEDSTVSNISLPKEQAKKETTDPKKQTQLKIDEAATVPKETVSPTPEPPEKVVKVTTVDVGKVVSRLRSIVGSGEYTKELLNKVLLNLVDIGGQPGFMEMFPFLSKGAGIFLVFFRLDKDLNDMCQVSYERGKDKITPYDSTYTSRETLSQILSAISHHTKIDSDIDREQCSKLGNLGSAKPVATLIGTFKDELAMQIKVDLLYEKCCASTKAVKRHCTTASKSHSATADKSDGTTASKSDSTTVEKSDSTTASKSDSTTASKSDSTTASKSDSTTASKSHSTTASRSDSTTASKSDSTTASKSDGTTASKSDSTTASKTTASKSDSTTADKSDSTTASESDSTTASESDSTTASESDSTTASESDSTTADKSNRTTASKTTASKSDSTTASKSDSTTADKNDSTTASKSDSTTASKSDSTTASKSDSTTADKSLYEHEQKKAIRNILTQQKSDEPANVSAEDMAAIEQTVSQHLNSDTFKKDVQDRLEQKLTEKNEAVTKITSKFEKLLSNPKDKKFIAVDNYEGTDSDMEPLREHLHGIFSSYFKDAKLRIRPQQLLLGVVLRKEFDIVSMEECIRIGTEGLKMTEKEVRFTVWYLDRYVGALIYHPEIKDKDGWFGNFVICNPQVVFNSLSVLVVKPLLELHSEEGNIQFNDNERKNWILMGQFLLKTITRCHSEENHVDQLIPVEKLLILLEHSHLLAKITTVEEDHTTEEVETTYFIPAILKCASREELTKPPPTGIDTPSPIKITFKPQYVPIGVFCAMISELVSRGSTGILGMTWKLATDTSVKRNLVSFHIDESAKHFVTLIANVDCYEIRIIRQDRDHTMHELCSYVLSTLLLVMKDISPLLTPIIAFDCYCGKHEDGSKLCLLTPGADPCFKCTSKVSLSPHQECWFAEEVSLGDDVFLLALPFASKRELRDKSLSFEWSKRRPRISGTENELEVKAPSNSHFKGFISCEISKNQKHFFTVYHCLKESVEHTSSSETDQLFADVKEVIKEIRSDWYSLAIELDIDYATRKSLEKDYRWVEPCFEAMLTHWVKRSSPPPSWCALIRALESPAIARGDIATTIKTKATSDISPGICHLTHGEGLSVDHHLRVVRTAAWEVRGTWRPLGEQLGVNEGTLDAIKRDYPNDSDMCFTKLLEQWLTRFTPAPTLGALIQALESPVISRGDFAQQMESKLT